MRISYMREFCALAEALSFTRAAVNLHMTQQSLSRHIAALEAETGLRLVSRTTHAVALTEAGWQVFEEFQRIVRQYDDMLEKTALLSAGRTGELKVGMLHYAIEEYITPMVAGLKEALPNIQFSFAPYMPIPLIQELLDGGVDLALTVHIETIRNDLLVYRNIHRERLAAAVLTEHRLAGKNRLTASDFTGETVILLKELDYHNNEIKKVLQANGVDAGRYVLAEDVDSITFALQETGGVYIGLSHLRRVQRHSVVWLDIENENFYLDIAFAYRLGNSNPAIPLFLEQVGRLFV
jgi:DNA-binding transcriptional LysR family regulator